MIFDAGKIFVIKLSFEHLEKRCKTVWLKFMGLFIGDIFQAIQHLHIHLQHFHRVM
jgi:hypothetical protein